MVARKFTDAQAADALMKHYGNVSAAAEALGVKHPTLFDRLKRKPELQKIRVQAEEQLLDLAENKLWGQVDAGNMTAIIFALKTRGQKRGYIETQHIQQDTEMTINLNRKIKK